MHDPREPHLALIKRILRYIKGTLDYGLKIVRSSTLDLIAYSDADWAGCADTWRSTSGYAVFFEDNLVSWSSKRLQTVSRSSAKAEYRAIANAIAKISWLGNSSRNSSIVLGVPLWYFVTTSAQFISQPIRCNISVPNMLRSIYISSATRLPRGKFVFFMSHLLPNMRMCLPRTFLPLFLLIFVLVWMSPLQVVSAFQLRGVLAYYVFILVCQRL
jgi:hypothetical protein